MTVVHTQADAVGRSGLAGGGDGVLAGHCFRPNPRHQREVAGKRVIGAATGSAMRPAPSKRAVLPICPRVPGLGLG